MGVVSSPAARKRFSENTWNAGLFEDDVINEGKRVIESRYKPSDNHAQSFRFSSPTTSPSKGLEKNTSGTNELKKAFMSSLTSIPRMESSITSSPRMMMSPRTRRNSDGTIIRERTPTQATAATSMSMKKKPTNLRITIPSSPSSNKNTAAVASSSSSFFSPIIPNPQQNTSSSSTTSAADLLLLGLSPSSNNKNKSTSNSSNKRTKRQNNQNSIAFLEFPVK